MADRLQKTLGTVDSVASVGQAPAEVDVLSQALPQVGQLIGNVTEAVGEHKADALEGEFEGLASDVAAVRANKDFENASDRMKRLAKGAEQGILSDHAIKLETEALLKSSIEKNPLFASKLRRRAAEVLGFDPTGTEMQALLGFGKSQKSRPLTEQEKIRAKAEKEAEILGGDADAIERAIYKGVASERNLQAASDQARLGEFGSDEVLNVSLSNVDSYVNDAFGQLFSAIDEGGLTAISSTERVASLTQSKEAMWNRHRKALTDANINLSSAKMSEQRKQFDVKFEGITELFKDDATMETLLTSQNKALIAQASIQGHDFFPGLSAINKALGQAGVQEYLKTFTGISSKDQLDLMKKISPSFAAVADNRAKSADMFRASFNKIMGIPQDGEVSDPALESGVERVMLKETIEPAMRSRILKNLQAKGQNFKAFGDYGQKGVRAKVTPEEVTYVKERWGVEHDPLISRVAASVKGVEGVTLTVNNGVLQIVSKGATAENAPTSMAILGNAAQIPSGLAADVKRINGMNKLVQNGWANDVGENAFGFLERTINQVETLSADEETGDEPDATGTAFDTFLSNPTPENLEAIKALDPELVRAAESILLNSGSGESDGK